MKICLNLMSRRALTDHYRTHFSHHIQCFCSNNAEENINTSSRIGYQSNNCHFCGAGIGTLKKDPLLCAVKVREGRQNIFWGSDFFWPKFNLTPKRPMWIISKNLKQLNLFL